MKKAKSKSRTKKKGKKLIPNYFEFLITPLDGSKIQNIGFRPYLIEQSAQFNVKVLPINQPDRSVFMQVWGTEINVMTYKQFIEDNKPQKKTKYRVDVISKSYRTEDMFEVLYFIDTLTLGQIKRGVDFAINAMEK